jgi:hypothetical protein
VLQKVADGCGLKHICWYGRVAVISKYRLTDPVLVGHRDAGSAPLRATIGKGGTVMVKPTVLGGRGYDGKPWLVSATSTHVTIVVMQERCFW